MRTPCSLVIPIERSTPYSQMLSLIFSVIEIISKKNAMPNAITVTRAVKQSKIRVNDSDIQITSALLSIHPPKPLNYDRIPFAIISRSSAVISGLNFKNRAPFGTPSFHLYFSVFWSQPFFNSGFFTQVYCSSSAYCFSETRKVGTSLTVL